MKPNESKPLDPERMVLGFMFDNDLHPAFRQVALILKQRPKWQEGLWNGIGGHIKEGETPEQAMQREFNEEAGINTDAWERCIEMSGEFEGKHHWVLYTFRAACPLEGLPVKSETDEKVGTWALSSLWGLNTIGNLKWIVPLLATNTIEFPIKLLNRDCEQPIYGNPFVENGEPEGSEKDEDYR